MISKVWLPRASACLISIAMLVAVCPLSYAIEATKADKSLPPKTTMALKLAGLVTFVASSCPELQPDYQRFKGAIGALGVSTGDLEKEELKGAYLSYALRYKADREASCTRALKDFGPGGGVIADLVKPKSR